LEGFFLTDEQSLIPRPWMVAADKTNEHGGSSANPPAASLYGERNMIAIKYFLISIK
jgi:hypothetical protein